MTTERKRKDRDLPYFKALFLLAGIAVKDWIEVANQYWPDHPDYFDIATHWYLAETERGFVLIGWRKRVLNIDWARTKVRGEVTKDDVTKSETIVHAWNYQRALDYLIAWEAMAQEQEREADPR